MLLWMYLAVSALGRLRRQMCNDCQLNAARGFPGMLGIIDCMHWSWENCPVAWQRSYRDHKHTPTIILEDVASYDTWIWKSYFGIPGSNNNLNVLARYNVFEDLLHGRTPPVNYEINNNQNNMGILFDWRYISELRDYCEKYEKAKFGKKSFFSNTKECNKELRMGIRNSTGTIWYHTPTK